MKSTGKLLCRGLLAGLVALCVLPAVAAAQADAPLMVEGPVSALVPNGDGSASLTVFGRAFRIEPGTPISTPTAVLSIEDLVNPASLPGRSLPGFVGGTTIMNGFMAATGEAVISDVFVEPAENVLVGVVTANEDGAIQVAGARLAPLADPRMPAGPVLNEYGFEVLPASVPLAAPSSVEGYWGEDGRLHYFLLQTTGGILANQGPQTSILRARCVAGGRLEVTGAVHTAPGSSLRLTNARTGAVLGNVVATPVDTVFGTYLARIAVNAGDTDTPGACPSEVLVTNLTHAPASTAHAAVDGVAPVPVPVAGVAPTAVNDADTTTVGLAFPFDLLGNDTTTNTGATLDPASLLFGVPAGSPFTLVNNLDGHVTFTASAPGVYSFTYSVADSTGMRSNAATATVTVTQPATDTIVIERATFRTSQARFNVRATSNLIGVTGTATLLRAGVVVGTIGTAVADATGAIAIDVRNRPFAPRVGDIVRVVSTGGGVAESALAISR